MTAKEKANEIAMTFVMEVNSTDPRFGIDKELAVQCAIVTVNEMIKLLDLKKPQYEKLASWGSFGHDTIWK